MKPPIDFPSDLPVIFNEISPEMSNPGHRFSHEGHHETGCSPSGADEYNDSKLRHDRCIPFDAMKNAYEAETIAFIEALAGEYAEEVSVRRQWTTLSRDPWCERIEVLAVTGALVAF